ncbi:MAG TPA: DsbC family protein [Sedimenticola sp.]|nr:DsbC family protein [Sedimenticola sp.]
MSANKTCLKPLAAIGFTTLLLASTMAMPARAGETGQVPEEVMATLKARIPELASASVTPAPVPGLYEVVAGPDVLYVTKDGRYLIRGSIIDLEAMENITAPRIAMAAAAAVEKVGEENMVIYEPEKTRHTVTIFTDIDCGFCRKLHGQMDEYLEKGIRIRYLFFPRAGLKSASYRKAVSVWCADDRNEAMTQAKAGKEIEMRDCDNPVSDHYALGQQMNVRGTPALVLEDGKILPGYVPPGRLSEYLDAR